MRAFNRYLMFFSICSVSVIWASACSDDSGAEADKGTLADKGPLKDLVAGKDQAVVPDLGTLPDLGQKTKCESEWRDAINPQTTKSTGQVTTTDEGSGVKKTVIDATAGGMSAASKNPYVYVSLKDGSRVELDDYSAKTSSAWDLAFKRAVIRVNGGDSGAGQGAVHILASTTLDKVTAVPASATFKTDDFLDESCQIKTDPVGSIWTAFGGTTGMWYTMDTSTMKLSPNSEAYVVRTAAGTFAAVVIDTYYSTAGTSAMYTIRWKILK